MLKPLVPPFLFHQSWGLWELEGHLWKLFPLGYSEASPAQKPQCSNCWSQYTSGRGGAHTGKDGDVVLVGLVQSVVHDALLIRKAFEDVHADLGKGKCE